jgi:intraflagellar transport protein 88
VRLGEYQNAINSYETILKGTPDHITAYNLIIFLYAAGDKLRMKDCFTRMITNPVVEEERDVKTRKEEPNEDGIVLYDMLKEKANKQRRNK